MSRTAHFGQDAQKALIEGSGRKWKKQVVHAHV